MITLFEGLHLKIPTIIPIKGKGFINQGLGYHYMRGFARRESFLFRASGHLFLGLEFRLCGLGSRAFRVQGLGLQGAAGWKMSCESSSGMQQPQWVVSYLGDPYESLPWNIPITVLIHLSVSLVLCREKGRVFVVKGLVWFDKGGGD